LPRRMVGGEASCSVGCLVVRPSGQETGWWRGWLPRRMVGGEASCSVGKLVVRPAGGQASCR